jgi:hypothetical protein
MVHCGKLHRSVVVSYTGMLWEVTWSTVASDIDLLW